MNISIIGSQYDRNIFNRVAIHPLQSWEWGDARSKMGTETLRIGEFEHNELVHGYQITFHKIPATPYKIGYLPRSPFPSSALLEFLMDFGKKHRVVFFKIEPNVKKSDLHNETMKQWSNFKRSPHPLFPEWTIQLDLTPTDEELIKRTKSKTRYNIRLAQKKGVVVKEMSTDEGFEIFSKLYFETCKRQGYFGHTKRYHSLIWDSLKNGVSHILIAFYQNVPLAAYELFHFNNVLYYPYGGTSFLHRNLMGANLLMWESILLGKRLGAHMFDMWGSLPPEHKDSHDWSGFTRFKEGYGGAHVQMIGSFDLIVSPLHYSAYTLADKGRKFFLKWKR